LPSFTHVVDVVGGARQFEHHRGELFRNSWQRQHGDGAVGFTDVNARLRYDV